MAVHFVAEHPRAYAVRYLGYFHKSVSVHQSACRVVRIVDANHLYTRDGELFQLSDVRQIIVFLPQPQNAHLRSKRFWNRIELLVGRHHAHDAVSSGNQRNKHMMIRSGCAVRRDDMLRLERAVEAADPFAERRRTFNISVGQTFDGKLFHKGRGVRSRYFAQLFNRNGIHAGLGYVVPGSRLPCVHPLFDGERLDSHKNPSR